VDTYIAVANANRAEFSVTLDLEQLGASHIDGMARLTIPARLRHIGEFYREEDGNPTILSMHGLLFAGETYIGLGAWLAPPEDLPMQVPSSRQNLAAGLSLNFVCSRAYIQYLEEERARTNPRQNLQLLMRLWGSVGIIRPDTSPAAQLRDSGLSPFKTQNDARLRIARSDWLDIYLPNLGYPEARTVELPQLQADTMAAELRLAVERLNQAMAHFDHEEYRQAVHFCRQARDALLGDDKTTWTTTVLVPVIGKEKADMVNDSIRALNHLGHPASHGESTIEVDRESARFVVGILTLVLRYIDQKLK